MTNTALVKVVQSELGRLVQRRAELEEDVRHLKQELKSAYPFDEERERKRRQESLEYLRNGIAERIKQAEDYVVAEIVDPHIKISNRLGEAEVELSQVRKLLKAYLA